MENNEGNGKLRANHFLILITFFVSVEKLFHNDKTNTNQRCYKRIEYGMTGRKNWNKVKLTCLCINLTYILCRCDSYNHGNNIVGLFDALSILSFMASETKHDY